METLGFTLHHCSRLSCSCSLFRLSCEHHIEQLSRKGETYQAGPLAYPCLCIEWNREFEHYSPSDHRHTWFITNRHQKVFDYADIHPLRGERHVGAFGTRLVSSAVFTTSSADTLLHKERERKEFRRIEEQFGPSPATVDHYLHLFSTRFSFSSRSSYLQNVRQ